jgi:excisionase family DNA binding protein
METHTTHVLQSPDADKRLTLSVPEAAWLLGISPAHGYELAARGVLPTLRLGHRIVVPRAALLALVGMAPEPD